MYLFSRNTSIYHCYHQILPVFIIIIIITIAFCPTVPSPSSGSATDILLSSASRPQPITTPRLCTWRSQHRPVRIVSIVLHRCLHPAWNINLPARQSAQSCSPARSCTPGWGCLVTSEAVPVLASSRTVQQSCPRNARRVRPLHPPS